MLSGARLIVQRLRCRTPNDPRPAEAAAEQRAEDRLGPPTELRWVGRRPNRRRGATSSGRRSVHRPDREPAAARWDWQAPRRSWRLPRLSPPATLEAAGCPSQWAIRRPKAPTSGSGPTNVSRVPALLG